MPVAFDVSVFFGYLVDLVEAGVCFVNTGARLGMGIVGNRYHYIRYTNEKLGNSVLTIRYIKLSRLSEFVNLGPNYHIV